MNVLVVDDLETTAALLEDFLGRHGCRAAHAGSAEAAVEALRRGGFDAAILDFCLPGADGLALLRAIRSGGGVPGGESLPVLVVTALSGPPADEIRDALKRYQPAAILTKPADPDLILSELRRLTAGGVERG